MVNNVNDPSGKRKNYTKGGPLRDVLINAAYEPLNTG